MYHLTKEQAAVVDVLIDLGLIGPSADDHPCTREQLMELRWAVTQPVTPATDIVTLERLAAEGKFMSAKHQLPANWMTGNFAFTLNGVTLTNPELFFVEIYAPGNETGWAVVYKKRTKGEHWDGATEVLHGNYEFWEVEEDE